MKPFSLFTLISCLLLACAGPAETPRDVEGRLGTLGCEFKDQGASIAFQCTAPEFEETLAGTRRRQAYFSSVMAELDKYQQSAAGQDGDFATKRELAASVRADLQTSVTQLETAIQERVAQLQAFRQAAQSGEQARQEILAADAALADEGYSFALEVGPTERLYLSRNGRARVDLATLLPALEKHVKVSAQFVQQNARFQGFVLDLLRQDNPGLDTANDEALDIALAKARNEDQEKTLKKLAPYLERMNQVVARGRVAGNLLFESANAARLKDLFEAVGALRRAGFHLKSFPSLRGTVVGAELAVPRTTLVNFQAAASSTDDSTSKMAALDAFIAAADSMKAARYREYASEMRTDWEADRDFLAAVRTHVSAETSAEEWGAILEKESLKELREAVEEGRRNLAKLGALKEKQEFQLAARFTLRQADLLHAQRAALRWAGEPLEEVERDLRALQDARETKIYLQKGLEIPVGAQGAFWQANGEAVEARMNQVLPLPSAPAKTDEVSSGEVG